MAQIITDLSKIEALTPFEGVPVVATGIEVPGLSGGLNDALRVDPIEKHKDEDVVLVVKGTVAKVRFDPVKGHEDAWQRVHILKVVEVALIGEDVVAEALEDQRRRIDSARRRAEEAEGIFRLESTVESNGSDGAGDEEEPHVVMGRIHNTGGHKDGLRRECTLCALEVETAAEENGTTVEDEWATRTVIE